MKKIISMLLAVVMVLGVLPVTSFATTSDMNVIEPDSWYSILLPQNASDELQNAAEELNFFLDEITGITLNVVTDDGSATADGCYISIGNTSLFQNSGVSADALEPEASAIKTTGDSILLFGGSDVGATYAVYELLEHWFNLKFYTPDCYTYTAKETVAFEELDLTSTPAVAHRTVGMYLTWYSSWTNLRRMRVSNAEDYMDRLGHSFFTLMPPATYYGAHPEWYSNYETGREDNWQLCLSNQEMRAQLLANVKAKLASQGDKTYFAIVQNDGEGFCTCDNCKALNLKYSNSNSKYAGACLEVVNEIAAACAEEYPNVIFYMLAYTNFTCEPPTKNITAASNVGVMYAPIDCNRTYSYFGNSGSADYTNGWATTIINGWDAICDHLMMWGYNAQFGDAMVPTNSYDSLKANAEGYAAYDFEVVFEQAIGSALPNFETLRNYLTAKALYDGTIDTFAEVDNFINAYYGPAASAISDYFDAHLANLRAFEAKGNAYKSWAAGQYLNGDYRYSPAIITDNYSKSYVDTCKGYFDAAYAALANAYSADSAAYATYKKRIDLEYFGVLYLYLELYADQLSQEEGAAMVKLAEKIINENSVTAINGQKINSWRNQFNVIPDAIDYTFFENIGDAQSCNFTTYTGVVGGMQVTNGVRITSAVYQPSFKFTESAVGYIKAYAQANGYDVLRIHAYADLHNNALVLNNQLWVGAQWSSLDVDVASLTTDFIFFSGSEGLTDAYLTFEFRKSDLINKNSFVGAGFGFENFEGNVGGKDITGVRALSASYQPTFYFTEAAVAAIKEYAAANDVDTLKINAYAIVTNNAFVMNNQVWLGAEWKTLEVNVADLSTAISFWSQSEGTTEIYLTFELYKADLINKTSFAGSGWGFENYTGNVGGKDISGVRALSASYQPTFYFTEAAVAAIKEYAAANDVDTLKINAYAIVTNNAFVMNNQVWLGAEWKTLEINVADLSTAISFWSQSEGSSDIYLTFEFYKAELINKTSFVGAGWGFENYTGNVGGKDISGVRALSASYQPTFYFTEAAVAAIKEYAAANNVDTLKINAYAILSNNGFILNGAWIGSSWVTVEIPVADLSTAISFWSQSEGSSDIYLTFELYKADLINKNSFTGAGVGFENYTGNVGGKDISGVRALSGAYQPTFYFTEAAIAEIKAYADANGYNAVEIGAYGIFTNNCGVINNALWYGSEWTSMAFSVDAMTTSFPFTSLSEGTTEIYLTFEFVHSHVYDSVVTDPTCTTQGYTTHTCSCGDSYVDSYVDVVAHNYVDDICSVCGAKYVAIKASSFTSSVCGFYDVTENVGGRDISGVRVLSASYQPSFSFTEAAIAEIKAYAEAKGYDTLTISAYAVLTNNAFVVNNQMWVGTQWTSLDVDIASLTTGFTFFSGSEGTSDIYMTFEFYKAELINKSSFVGAGWGFADYTGNIGGQDIVGVHAWSDVYQPTFYFTEAAIAKIKAYAAENGYNTLKVNAYANLYNNGFICAGTWTGAAWTTTEISVDSLSTSIAFFSQSEGRSDVYLTFELYKAELINKNSFVGSGWGFENYTGNVGGKDISGVRALSASYQPTFYFTEAAIAAIKEYAAANDVNTLKINAYAIVTNNAFVMNNQVWLGAEWKTLEINVADLSTAISFWSQSEGSSDIYLTFEFVHSHVYDSVVTDPTCTTQGYTTHTCSCGDSYVDSYVDVVAHNYVDDICSVCGAKYVAIKASSFTSSVCGFYDVTENVGGRDISGVRVLSASYQPSFSFTEAAIAEIKAYAEAKGYDTLKISAYAIVSNNSFVVNNQMWVNTEWNSLDVDIASLTTGFTFFSGSEGTSDIYMTFEFYKAELINKSSFVGAGWGFADYTGNIGGQDIVGVHAWSDVYQPTFYFTEAAIAKIKAYAAENGYNTLKVNAYANLYNNGFICAGTWTGAAWTTTEISVDSLSTSIAFFSQSEGRSDVYLTFELYKAELINKNSFVGSGWGFENYTGNVGGKDISGVRALSASYQPTFYFTEAAIAAIKEYAAANDVNTLKINAYAIVTNNAFVMNNQVWLGAEWKTLEINVADLSTAISFWSQSEGSSDIYLTFEFYKAELINKSSFVGGGWGFADYTGNIGGQDIVGVHAWSDAYQPTFYFTEAAITKIKAYAAENGYNTLKINAYANLYNNGFICSGTWTGSSWTTTEISVDDLSTSISFWSQSEGRSDVYLTFEFAHKHIYSDWVVTTPATLQAAGEQQKTCSCGDVITEVIPCLAGDVESWGLTLGGDLSVNFMLSVHEDIRETAKIVISVNGVATEYAVAELAPNADSGLYYVSVNVAAAQMNDTITVQIVNGEDASVTKEYTVAQYAKVILANDSYSAYHALVKEMLNYGDAAQTYFGYNVDNRTDVNLEGVGTVEVPADAAADMAVSGKVDGISFYGASLLFRNKIAVRYYFTVTGNISDYTFTANGAEIGYDEKDGLYYIEVADINPQDLDDAITVAVNDTLTVSYSPMNYIVRMSTKGSDNLKALMKALYNYHLAAEIIVPDVV